MQFSFWLEQLSHFTSWFTLTVKRDANISFISLICLWHHPAFPPQKQVFLDVPPPFPPKVTPYLTKGQGLPAGVCSGVVAFSLPPTKKFPHAVQPKLGFSRSLSPLAATVSAEEPRSRGQLLTPCQLGMFKECFPLLMKCLDLFILESFSCALHHSCVACLDEIHLA